MGNKNDIEAFTAKAFTTDEECLFYDSYSDRFFKSTVSKINKIFGEFAINKQFVSLNEIYESIGLPTITDRGDLFGINFQSYDCYYSPYLVSYRIIKDEEIGYYAIAIVMRIEEKKEG